MIFDSFETTREKNELRQNAIRRKLRETEFRNNDFNMELDILECFEQLYQSNKNMPYIELIYENGDKTHSGIDPDSLRYYISIQSMTAEKIQLFSEECFSAPISEIKKMYYSERGIDYQIPDSELYEQSLFQLFSNCKNHIASYVYRNAIIFIALHEFAHVTNQHVKYLYDKNVLISNEIKRGMELQADISAAVYFSNYLKTDEKYVDMIHHYPSYLKKGIVNNTYQNAITLAILSVYVSFRCYLRKNYFWNSETDFVLDGYTDHPLIEARMKTVVDVLLKTICPDIPSNEDYYLRSFVSSLIYEFEHFMYLNHPHDDSFSENYHPLKLMSTPQGKDYEKELRSSLELADYHLHDYQRILFDNAELWENYF